MQKRINIFFQFLYFLDFFNDTMEWRNYQYFFALDMERFFHFCMDV